MTSSLAVNEEFGTSTSVSGSWANTFDDANDADGAARSAILVVAIAGREALCGKIGTEETQRAVDRCLSRAIRAAEALGGRLVETRWSEIVAEFSDADTALQSAIEMQNRVTELPPVSGLRLTLQIGLSYGTANEQAASPFGPIVEMADNLAKLAEPGQIVACIRAQTALSDDLKNRFDVYCLEWKTAKSTLQDALPNASGPDGTTAGGVDRPAGILILKFNGQIYRLDDNNPVIRIGRLEDNHVILKGNHASRHHANIRRRGKQVIFTDTSTNGTFVSFKNAPPHLLLVHGECVLHGTGVLSFSTANPDTGIGTTSARFEVL
jgi:class 3 adenylate cyclase